MAFFHPFQSFSPLFRLIDEVERSFPTQAFTPPVKTFAPRVNIAEEQQQYLLQAELPGLEQKDINIEWTDANTLTISGRSETRTETAPQQPEETPAVEPARPASPTLSEKSWHQASVEDAVDEDAPKSSASDIATPAVENDQQVAQTPAPQAVQQQQTAPQPKFWVKERSVGEFSRSFNFPTRVEHDAVKATLKNGILSVVVPKAQPVKTRRIQVE